jgi:deoxyribose-phosphate aldolase
MDHEQTLAPAVDVSSLLEFTQLAPDLTETDICKACDLVKARALSALIVRPSDVDLAIHWIPRLGTVVDWPYGNATTSVKAFGTRDMLRRGAKEINTVMNTSKLLSRHFQYLETELMQMADACHQSGAIIKVAIESQYLNEEHKILACRIAKRTGVDYIGTSVIEDVPLLKEYGRDRFHLLYTGSAGNLDQALELHQAGFTRIQTSSPLAILEEWEARQQASKQDHVLS